MRLPLGMQQYRKSVSIDLLLDVLYHPFYRETQLRKQSSDAPFLQFLFLVQESLHRDLPNLLSARGMSWRSTPLSKERGIVGS
jgi:hypothetical protein